MIETKKFTLNANYIYNVVIYTPDGTTGKLPAVVFIPGNGESNSNVNGLYVHGPLKFIKDGWKPDFIVIGIQPLAGPGPISWVQHALDTLSDPTYRIDWSRWGLTGLSYGAAAIFQYIKGQTEGKFKAPSFIIPMSITTNAQCGDFYQNTDHLCGTDFRYATIPAWGLAGSGDSHYGKMKRFFQRLIEAGYNAKWTTYSGGHSGWNTFYNPAWKENGISLYEWAMQWASGGVMPVKLSEFKASGNYLSWTTDMEENTDKFIIEESTDGLNFKEVGEVKAVGNSQVKNSYKWRLQ